MKLITTKIALYLLCFTLIFPYFNINSAYANEDVNEPIYIATNTVALKIRSGPGEEYSGVGSIPKYSNVHIIDIQSNWTHIIYEKIIGYVKTEFLIDIHHYDAKTRKKGELVDLSKLDINMSVEHPNGFIANYKAHSDGTAVIYESMDKKSRVLDTIPTYKELQVEYVDGDWCYAQYKGTTGYIQNRQLFKWDRLNPYAGIIPGLDIITMLAYTNKTTTIYSLETDKELFTVNPGSALSIIKKDEENDRYVLLYWREYAYVNAEDIVTTTPVHSYDTAQVGDLIGAMSTYYAVGVSTLQYQGRNWNIYTASSFISGTRLAPNEVFDSYDRIGPYRQSTGYKAAPIMASDALWGYGGGTCQVTTTLYITIAQLPILVTHRKVHAEVGIYYAKKGFDAATGGGDINMTFTNTLPYPVQFEFFMSDGVLTCAVYRCE